MNQESTSTLLCPFCAVEDIFHRRSHLGKSKNIGLQHEAFKKVRWLGVTLDGYKELTIICDKVRSWSFSLQVRKSCRDEADKAGDARRLRGDSIRERREETGEIDLEMRETFWDVEILPDWHQQFFFKWRQRLVLYTI